MEPVQHAKAAGMTVFDTAFVYNNEKALGTVVEQSDFVITKFWRSQYSHKFEDIQGEKEREGEVESYS